MKQQGYCEVHGSNSYVIDAMDARPGDVIACSSIYHGQNTGKNYSFEDQFHQLNHVQLIRRLWTVTRDGEILRSPSEWGVIKDTDTMKFQVWQLGGAKSKTNIGYSDIKGAHTSKRYVLRRINIYDDYGLPEKDPYNTGQRIPQAWTDRPNKGDTSQFWAAFAPPDAEVPFDPIVPTEIIEVGEDPSEADEENDF